MSPARPEDAERNGNGSAPASERELFTHEARREGRTVAVLTGTVDPTGGVTVHAAVSPVSAPATSPPQVMPYHFPSREAAQQFVDEALLALEYLGCVVGE